MSDSEKPSQAMALVALAKANFDMVMSQDGRPYGVRRNGPRIARPFKGRGGLRSQLAKQFTENNGGKVASASALADTMTVLEGIADSGDPVPVHLRVARYRESIVLDLGTADGRAVVVTPDGWELYDRSPVLFRRSGAMATMPAPEQGRDGIALLRDLVNMDDSAFHRLVAWLVAAWIPDVPHPVLTFKGEQGTGKSYTAQMLINLVDPSAATKRSQPRDIKAWSVQAFNSWALCLDNISIIPPWLSDTLCKAVTGDGIVDRALYSDDDVVVLTFRRVLAMTTIDAGALAGDLAERMMALELQPIPDSRRRSEEDLDAAYNAARPVILGSLLDLLSQVQATLPGVHLDEMPRLADFARVLAAVDQVTGWTTLADYTGAARSVNADALEGDPFGSAVAAWIGANGAWTGTAAQLMDLIPPPDGYHPQWPKDPTRASGRLKRLAPVLRSVGISYDDSQRTPDRARQRLIQLTPSEEWCITASAAPAASATGPDLRKGADATADAGTATASAVSVASATASATHTAPDLHRQDAADATGTADASPQHFSRTALHCAHCGRPMAPELTAAGHLTHPDCTPDL